MSEYMTVTLVVEYDPTKVDPDEWNWDLLTDGKARVVNAWATEPDELARAFDVCQKCGLVIPSEDDVVWIKTSTGAAAGPPVGDAYHVGCAPEQPDMMIESRIEFLDALGAPGASAG